MKGVLLTPESESALLEAWQERRDHDARKALVDAFEPLLADQVALLERRSARAAKPAVAHYRSEIVRTGRMAVLSALERFDRARGGRVGPFVKAVVWDAVCRAGGMSVAEFRKGNGKEDGNGARA